MILYLVLCHHECVQHNRKLLMYIFPVSDSLTNTHIREIDLLRVNQNSSSFSLWVLANVCYDFCG